MNCEWRGGGGKKDEKREYYCCCSECMAYGLCVCTVVRVAVVVVGVG